MIAMGNLAKLFDRRGQGEAAAHYWDQVEGFQKKNPYYHYSLGEEAYESKRFEDAVKHYQEALKRNSKEHHFHFALAKTYTLMGKVSEAVKHLEKAHELAPYGSGKNRYSQKLEILASRPKQGRIRSDTLSTVE